MRKAFYSALLLPFALLMALPAQAAPPVQAVPTANTEWSFDRSSLDVPIGNEVSREVPYDEEDIVNVFRVANQRLYKNYKWTRNTDTNEQKVWDIFEGIAGTDFTYQHIGVYLTYNLPHEPVLAFVTRISNKQPSWMLAVNTNASSFENRTWVRDAAIILTHEYTHLLTLDKDQVEFKKKSPRYCAKTGRYLSLAGCTKKDSYLDAFVKAFWSAGDVADAREAREKGKTPAFYNRHLDDFTTKYGASGPEEDIAESFTDFVLRAKPAGTLKKDQKILFFYQYPEFVTMRDSIRASVQQYFI
ncbi:MAG: hypothetical protein WDN10_02355 [bacterium]